MLSFSCPRLFGREPQTDNFSFCRKKKFSGIWTAGVGGLCSRPLHPGHRNGYVVVRFTVLPHLAKFKCTDILLVTVPETYVSVKYFKCEIPGVKGYFLGRTTHYYQINGAQLSLCPRFVPSQ